MLLQESRGVARTTTAGDPTRRPGPFTLEQGYQVAEGLPLAETALLSRRFGPDTLLAAIAAVHAEAPMPRQPIGAGSPLPLI
jgi:RNA polymerase sigma-70 factor (ECF subfamily)